MSLPPRPCPACGGTGIAPATVAAFAVEYRMPRAKRWVRIDPLDDAMYPVELNQDEDAMREYAVAYAARRGLETRVVPVRLKLG